SIPAGHTTLTARLFFGHAASCTEGCRILSDAVGVIPCAAGQSFAARNFVRIPSFSLASLCWQSEDGMTSALGRRLWILVGGALVLTALLVFLSGRGSTARVGVADVVRENLSSIVSTNGKVEPVTPHSFRARYPTFVQRVYAVEGQQVKRGQMLYQLNDT